MKVCEGSKCNKHSVMHYCTVFGNFLVEMNKAAAQLEKWQQ